MNDMQKPKAVRPIVPRDIARTLGWLSIGLGLAEALMPGPASRVSGINGSKTLLRTFGVREFANGVGILTAKDPSPWIWARVAGDIMDVSTLALRGRGSASALTLLAVAGVAALDVACASILRKERNRPQPPRKDYTGRSGLPEPPHQMRGAARRQLKPRLSAVANPVSDS
jgi:hypothetical protein